MAKVKRSPTEPKTGKSKYKPSVGHEEGQSYRTDEKIMGNFRKMLQEASVYDDPTEYFKRKKFENQSNPFGRTDDMTLDKTGKWKIDRNEKEGYTSIYNYNPIGDSFYDRVYDNEVKKLEYSDDQKKYISDLLNKDVIEPYRKGKNDEFAGWVLNKISNLPKDERGDNAIQYVKKWYNSDAAKKRYVKSGGSAKEYDKKLQTINKKLDTIKVVKPTKRIPNMMTGGENAYYDPSEHTAMVHSQNDDEGTYVHEITHGTDFSDDPHTDKIVQEVVNKYNTKSKPHKYMHSTSEVVSRIMDIRNDMNIGTDEVIEKEDFIERAKKAYGEDGKKVEQLMEFISVDGIVELLNKLAYNQNGNYENYA